MNDPLTHEYVHVDRDHFHCQVPNSLVDGDPVLCAGITFRQVDSDTCELVFLSERDVESLTSPEGDDGA
jgi:hypothetical protein